MKGRVMIRHLHALVMMQLKDKMDLSFLKSRRSIIFKTVLSLLLVACVTAVIYLLFSTAVTLRIFSFWAELPVTVVSVVFFAMFVLSVLSCTLGLTDTLFLSKDNQVLLTLPVPANWVFLSKLIIYYIYELRKNVVFTLPLFIAYGMVNSLAAYYYPWLIFGLIFVSMLPVMWMRSVAAHVKPIVSAGCTDQSEPASDSARETPKPPPAKRRKVLATSML